MQTMTQQMIETLRAEWSSLETVDPASNSFFKLQVLLNRAPQPLLKQLASANIKFVSKLAANRVY